MNEATMPATEAAVDTTDEVVSYELAFHVLPTVAEGEVAAVESAVKELIAAAGGVVGVGESPQRFDLAYELTKMIDGKYRRFNTSYFGWVRFSAQPDVVDGILKEVEARTDILRALLVRLTRQEEEHPFFLHEVLAASKTVTDIDVTAVPESAETEETDTKVSEEEPAAEVVAADEIGDDVIESTNEAADEEK